MARATKAELERRLDLAADMLAKGHSGTSVVTFMTDQEGGVPPTLKYVFENYLQLDGSNLSNLTFAFIAPRAFDS